MAARTCTRRTSQSVQAGGLQHAILACRASRRRGCELSAKPQPETIGELIRRHMCSISWLYRCKPIVIAIGVPKLIKATQALPILRVREVLEERINVEAIRQLAKPVLQAVLLPGGIDARLEVHERMRRLSRESVWAKIQRASEPAMAFRRQLGPFRDNLVEASCC